MTVGRSAVGQGRGFVVAGALFAGSASALSAQEPVTVSFLRKVIQLDDRQLAAVEKGEVVTKLLPTAEKPEIAAFGVVKAPGNTETLIRAARDMQRFRAIPQIPEMGIFSNPPRMLDLKGLHHPPDDIAALRKCKPGSCDVKLGDRGLEIASRIDWSRPNADQQAVALFNQALVEYVTAYAQGGTDALSTIVDKKDRKSRADEYRKLLANSPYLAEYLKEFNDYLYNYPKTQLADTEDILFWTKDTFGLKPVVSAYHLTLHKGPKGAIIANKLLYSSHFFNAGLEILAGVPTTDGKSVYLLSLYRTRLDPPTGMLSGMLMGKVKDGIETAVRENLKLARKRLATP
jgi:hypothetical protein